MVVEIKKGMSKVILAKLKVCQKTGYQAVCGNSEVAGGSFGYQKRMRDEW